MIDFYISYIYSFHCSFAKYPQKKKKLMRYMGVLCKNGFSICSFGMHQPLLTQWIVIECVLWFWTMWIWLQQTASNIQHYWSEWITPKEHKLMNNSDIEQQNTHPAPAKYTVIESHTLSCSMQITCRTQVQSSCFVCRQHLFAPEGESLIYRAAGPPIQHHSGRRSFSLMSNLVRNVYIIST